MVPSIEIAPGRRMPTIDVGEGPVVLLVHGYPLSKEMWSETVSVLSKAYRVLAPDLHGFGESPFQSPFSMVDLAKDLNGLLIALQIDQPINLVGLSMGGYVAFEFWDRYRSKLSKLVLCDTRAQGDTPEGAANRIAIADQVHQVGTAKSVEGMLPKLVSEQTRLNSPHVVERLHEMMLKTSESTIESAQRAMANRRSFEDRLGEIEVPTLVIVGEMDAISTSKEMKGIADRIPGSQWVELPKVGHMTPMESPREFSEQLLAFLRRS